MNSDCIHRAIVIGCPGAGKSTFARKLRDATGLPLHYLDMLRHRPDRTKVPREEFDRRLEELLAGERWIIDGNYRRTMKRRLEACDTVFFLDFPTEVCLSGAQERIGTQREDLPFAASLDEEFRQRILRFKDSDRPEIYEFIESFASRRRIIIFRSRTDEETFLKSLAIE